MLKMSQRTMTTIHDLNCKECMFRLPFAKSVHGQVKRKIKCGMSGNILVGLDRPDDCPGKDLWLDRYQDLIAQYKHTNAPMIG